MSSKLDELKKLRSKLNIDVEGLENCPEDGVNIYVANHNCLKDIFYLPMSLNEDIISLISARIVYKKEIERQTLANKYLYAMPIEAHGRQIYSALCLEYASSLLSEGLSLGIFPEGAYIKEDEIHKGRTGAARILFQSCNGRQKINLVPVAIDVEKEKIDLDSYHFDQDKVDIKILKPIDYYEDYEKFILSNDLHEKNICLHNVIDKSMKEIAKSLNKKYIDEYIELYPKGNVIFANGEVVETNLAQNSEYIDRYCDELCNRSDNISKQMIKK